MDWQTALRASVPLGAALLAVVALVASRRDRGARGGAEGLQGAASGGDEALARARLEFASPAGASEVVSRRRVSPGLRAAAAVVLVLLAAATGLVFVTSRPLADVEIESAVASAVPCPDGRECAEARVLAVSGTLAGVGGTEDERVLVLVKPASSSTWRVGAETRPGEDGDWRVEGVPLLASDEGLVEVRAVVERRSGRMGSAPQSEMGRVEGLPGSRIVRVGVGARRLVPARGDPVSPAP